MSPGAEDGGRVRRFWKAPDGRLLVEARLEDPAPDGYSLVDTEGRPVKGPAVYHLIGTDGRLVKTYGSHQGSVQEHLYWTGHVVKGSELRSWFNDVNTDARVEKIKADVDVEISGLTPADPGEGPDERRLRELLGLPPDDGVRPASPRSAPRKRARKK